MIALALAASCLAPSSAPTAPADTPTGPTDPGTDATALAGLDPSTLPSGDAPCREPVYFVDNYVVDGDTLYVTRPDGVEEKVRLIGIDTPELGHDGEPDECYAQEATELLRQRMRTGGGWLTFDLDCADDYGRTLAYLFVGSDAEDFLNRWIVWEGYARAFPVEPDTTFADAIQADEDDARRAGRGAWSACW